MKKLLSLCLVALLLVSALPVAQAAEGSQLISLVHNAPNTGIMLPEAFNPNQTTYLLTVASWVSRITFTPTPANPNATVTVNGQPVASGQKSQIIQMTDKPQQVSILVTAYDANKAVSSQTQYTVYLQRRPSERRTRVSAGFITEFTVTDGVANVGADLVTVNYVPQQNLSTYTNETVYIYRYKTSPNCLYYFTNAAGQIERARDAYTFQANYLTAGKNMYTIVYIEDEIVAMMPY